MKVRIEDSEALRAVSPASLAAYARAQGWKPGERYRKYSTVYAGEALPGIIVPRTQRLGDYASVVAGLIDTFTEVTGKDELEVYRTLVTADRDVVRVRVGTSDDGSVTLKDGIALIDGTRELLLAAACSLREPQAFYRAGANKEASELLRQVRLGQTEQSSFAVTLLTPPISPAMTALLPGLESEEYAPSERKMTARLMEALAAAREAVENAAAAEAGAFREVMEHGVSANLCEALVRLVTAFPTVEVGVSWAQTLGPPAVPSVVRFDGSDRPALREAARLFRARSPRPDVRLCGFVRLLKRGEQEDEGTIRLATSIGRKPQSVQVVLDNASYEKAVQAHQKKAAVILSGDLERTGQRWRLLSPRVEEVIRDEEPEGASDEGHTTR